MQLYSASPVVRSRQIALDVIAAAGIVAFAVLGVLLAAFIRTLADLGRSVESAGERFRSTLSDAAGTLGGIPLIGDAASTPLTKASGAGSTLVDAGQRQQELVGHASLIVGLVVALVPIAFILRSWLGRRLAFVRNATAARTLASTDGGVELLALRALSSRDQKALLAIAPDPVGAWRAGEPLTIRLLAELALREAGVAR